MIFRPTLTLGMALIVLSSCQTPRHARTPAGLPVYHRGTAAYAQKVATFNLTPDDARARLADYLSHSPLDPSARLVIGDHRVIVGDNYIFSPPLKSRLPLAGHYVNGLTGHVTEGLSEP